MLRRTFLVDAICELTKNGWHISFSRELVNRQQMWKVIATDPHGQTYGRLYPMEDGIPERIAHGIWEFCQKQNMRH